MATNRELEAQVRRLTEMLERAGFAADAPISTDPADRPDYIAFGSVEHAGIIGLVVMQEDEEPPRGQTVVLAGKIPGNLYCLEDELGAMRYHPGLSLQEVVPVILRQKIGEFEAGPPQVPENAPPMWTPTPVSEIVV